MQKFQTPSPVTVVLDIPAGQIRLVAAERTDTVVEVLPTEAAKRRDAKAAAQTKVEFSGGVLRIATADPNKILGSSGSLDVTIALPAGSRIEAKAGGAALYSTGRLGEVAFDGGYRAVELDEVGGARIKMHLGDVTIAKLTGPAQLRNGKGDITVAEAVAGAVDLRTGMGNLKIAAAPGVSGTLDASSACGRITNALKNSEGAGAGLNIKATTSQGDIIATSL